MIFENDKKNNLFNYNDPFLFSWENNEIEYIIYTKNSLINAAENLSNLYEEIVDDNFKLKTKIIIDDTCLQI